MSEADDLEAELMEKAKRLAAMRRAEAPVEVPDYVLETQAGPAPLSALFGEKDTLLAIHNMGEACRYCTLWADGLNALLPHLESVFAVVLLSKDPPEAQRVFANARGWRFRMASHGGGEYIREQSVLPGEGNAPGIVAYARRGDQVVRLNGTPFGPGDLYCPMWHVLSLAGVGEGEWTPQYAYWKRPSKLDDGGQKIVE